MFGDLLFANMSQPDNNYEVRIDPLGQVIHFRAEKQTTRKGDSGGPKFIKKNGKNYLVGLISTVGGSLSDGFTGTQIDVRYYADWIQSNAGIDLETFVEQAPTYTSDAKVINCQ